MRFIPRSRLAHLSPSAPKLNQPISTGWMMSSVLAWMPSMAAAIAWRLHEITMCTFSILASNSNEMVMDYQPKEGKTRPDPTFHSQSLPFSLSHSVSRYPHPPLGCLGYSSVTSGGYWSVKLKSGRCCTPIPTLYNKHTLWYIPAHMICGFGMGPLGVITLPLWHCDWANQDISDLYPD